LQGGKDMLRHEARSNKNGRSSRFLADAWAEDSPEFRLLDERLPESHLARTILAGMNMLDLGPIRDAYAGSGSYAFPPERLLAVILYELQVKRTRPSQWHKDARENDPVRWLLRGLMPSRTVWYDFRRRLRDEHLVQCQQTVLQHALQQGFTTGKSSVLDGTFVAANATRHHLAKRQKLEQRQQQLDEAIACDESAQAIESLPIWMGKTPARRLQQREQYRGVWRRMQQLQEKNQQKRASKRQDPDKIRVSISDPEAAVGYDKMDVYRPLYNVQLMGDLESSLVLAYDVFAQTTDAGTLGPLLQRHHMVFGFFPQEVIADAGYASGEHLWAASQANVVLIAPWQTNDYSDQKAKPKLQMGKEQFEWQAKEGTYYCPEGHRLDPLGPRSHQRSGPGRITLHMYRCPPEHCRACPRQSECTTGKSGRTISRSEHEELIDDLKERLKTTEAKSKLRRRGATVERLNADFKQHRGLQRFSSRGLKNAKIEVGLQVLSHNLRVVAQRQQARSEINSNTNPVKTGG
jgi:transposase